MEKKQYSIAELGYQIDNAYSRADDYEQGSEKWHFWMDRAVYWEQRLKEGK
jgi:hypothetical protein